MRAKGTDINGEVYINTDEHKRYKENFDLIKWRGDEDESDGDAD